jgi:hypothetical protein
MPQPCGFGFVICTFVDSDCAGNSIERRSRTGFVVYLNSAPVHGLSKKQVGTETSPLKQWTEYICGLCYMLCMMGIPCTQPAFIYGDNQNVLERLKSFGSHLRSSHCHWISRLR